MTIVPFRDSKTGQEVLVEDAHYCGLCRKLFSEINLFFGLYKNQRQGLCIDCLSSISDLIKSNSDKLSRWF